MVQKYTERDYFHALRAFSQIWASNLVGAAKYIDHC